jgi:hypothetical protein
MEHVVMMVSWISIWFFAFGGRPFGDLFFLFAAQAVWFACLFAGIRVMLLVLQASPLCGAAPTFLCRRKEK